jgi:hypothetical protein
MNGFIVVSWYGDIPYMLQGRDVLNWYFANNYIKVYKSEKTAIKAAYRVWSKYKSKLVKVYSIKEGEGICSDYIRRWEREERERVVFVLSI